MPYTLVHDGVTREFDFYAPPGWQYWVARAWLDEGRVGLPLVVALHGAGQEPLEFQEDWFFPEVWNQDLEGVPLIEYPEDAQELAEFLVSLVGYRRLLDNQFFVLYPYGMGWKSTAHQGLAYDLLPLPNIPGSPVMGTTFRPLYREDRPARGWNSGVSGVVTGPDVDDVGFIQEMMRVIGRKLRRELLLAKDAVDALTVDTFPWEEPTGETPLGEPVPPLRAPELFDADRRFLFGYSNGGMMAHRLVRAMPDHWAAVWGISTTVGGKALQGFGDPEDAVVNLPTSGGHSTSFFAHHGLRDEIAPPGDTEDGVLETNDFALQLPTKISLIYLETMLSGIGTQEEREDFLPGFLPLAQGWRGYIAYNGLSLETTARPRRGLESIELDIDVELPLGVGLPGKDEPDETPGIVLPGAHSYSSSDSGGAEPPYPYEANPIAVMYIDRFMSHTGFANHPNRYFFASDVWHFFRTHKRRQLLFSSVLPVTGFFP